MWSGPFEKIPISYLLMLTEKEVSVVENFNFPHQPRYNDQAFKAPKIIIPMVQILYQNLNNSDSNYYYIGIPKDWSGSHDDEVTVIVDDICVVVPQTIAGATGELIVLRLLEAMMAGNIIDAGDIQKAIEHIL